MMGMGFLTERWTDWDTFTKLPSNWPHYCLGKPRPGLRKVWFLRKLGNCW